MLTIGVVAIILVFWGWYIVTGFWDYFRNPKQSGDFAECFNGTITYPGLILICVGMD